MTIVKHKNLPSKKQFTGAKNRPCTESDNFREMDQRHDLRSSITYALATLPTNISHQHSSAHSQILSPFLS